MFKVIENSTPSVFANLFEQNDTIHSYPTRQLRKLHVPKAKRDYMKRCISIKGVRIWNSLYNLVPHNCTLPTFKFHLRKYLQITNDISRI